MDKKLEEAEQMKKNSPHGIKERKKASISLSHAVGWNAVITPSSPTTYTFGQTHIQMKSELPSSSTRAANHSPILARGFEIHFPSGLARPPTTYWA